MDVEVRGLEAEGGGHAVLDEAAALLAGPELNAAVHQRDDHADVGLHEAVAHARELVALGGQLEVGLFKLLVELLLKGRVEGVAALKAVGVEVEALAVADLAAYGLVGVLFVHAVGHAVQVETLVGLDVLVYDGGAVLAEGLLGVQDVGQRLVLDLYELAGGLGGLLVRGGDGGDEIADVADLLAHAVHDVAVGEIAADGGVVGTVLARDHTDDSGQLFGLGGVYALDYAVGDGAAQYLAVHHAAGVDVGGVFRLPGHLEQGVLAYLALPDGVVLSHVSLPPCCSRRSRRRRPCPRGRRDRLRFCALSRRSCRRLSSSWPA